MDSAAQSPPVVKVRSEPPSQRLWLAIWIVLGLALLVTGVLVWQESFGPKQAGAGEGLPGCGPGQPCENMLRGPYGRVLGYSLTKWSLFYCVLVAATMLVTIYAWQFSLAPPLTLLLPVLTVVGLAAASWSVAVMALVLNAFCVWCLTLDGLYAVLFFLSLGYAWQDWRYRQFIRNRAGVPPLSGTPVALHCIVAILLATTLLVGMNMFHGTVRDLPQEIELPAHALALKPMGKELLEPLSVDRTPSGIAPEPKLGEKPRPPGNVMWSIKGPRDAPYRLVMFVCPTCPSCRDLNSVVNKVMARHPDQLRVDVRFYPLWHTCNDHVVKGSMDARHQDACPLTRLALAVAMTKPEAFAPFLDWMYANQSTLDETVALSQAQTLVDKDALQRALDDDALWKRFREDMDLARRANVRTVPQLFLIGGRAIVGSQERYIRGGQVYGGMDARNLELLLGEALGWDVKQPVDDPGTSLVVAENLIGERANRGRDLIRRGRFSEAAAELKEAVRLDPQRSDAAVELAWLLATCPLDNMRNGTEAVHYARLAEQTAPRELPRTYDVLAAALAESGDFDTAVPTARKAASLYNQAGSKAQADEVQQRLDGYLRGQPYHQGTPAPPPP